MKGLTGNFLTVLVAVAALSSFSHQAVADSCAVPNSGGTADLPPVGCEYIPPVGDVMQILPPAIDPGDTIDLSPVLKDFVFNPMNAIAMEMPGGALGGHIQNYDATMQMSITGSGALAGFNRTVFIPVTVQSFSAPRTPGDAVQLFATELMVIQGSLFGDPDFSSLSIVGGTLYGMPSPGYTQLTLNNAQTNFQVDSFFDVGYRINFQGAPGSVLEGMGGPTEGIIRLEMGGTVPEPTSLVVLGVGCVAILRRR